MSSHQVPSPKLLSHISSPVTISPSTVLPIKQTSLSSHPSQASSGHTTPVLSNPSTLKTPTGHVLSTPTGVSPTTVASVVNINPQLLQALLASASQVSASKPVMIPLQQTPVHTVNSGTVTGLTTPTIVSCGGVYEHESKFSFMYPHNLPIPLTLQSLVVVAPV